MKFLPNFFSALRVVATPFLCLLLWRHEYRFGLAVLAGAAATDFLDGYSARRLNVRSHSGEVLDPIADKVLMAGVFLTLWLSGPIATWLAAIVIGRDVLILLVAALALALGSPVRRFPPSVWGKLSTGFQIAYVIAVLGRLAALLPGFPADILQWATAGMTLWSGADYGVRAARSGALLPRHLSLK